VVAGNTVSAAGVNIKLSSTVFMSCRARMASMPMSKTPVEQVVGISMLEGAELLVRCGEAPTGAGLAVNMVLGCIDGDIEAPRGTETMFAGTRAGLTCPCQSLDQQGILKRHTRGPSASACA
jgi:hypothetical protein